MKSIILLAAPAAGKGTQASLLKEKYNIPHISTGDLLRLELKSGSSLSNQLKEIMESGKLVNDEIILDLINKRINNDDCVNGYILDGFPRNINQAIKFDELLNKTSKKIDYVFLLDVDYETALNRSLGRISCQKCNLVYNDRIKDSMPKISNICDVCGEALIKRIDDNEETFKKRYDTYLNETKPLIDYYEKKGILYHIDSSINKDITSNEIIKILDMK